MTPHELKLAAGARVVRIRVREGYNSKDRRVLRTVTLDTAGRVTVEPPFREDDDMREVPRPNPDPTAERVYLTPDHGAEYMAAAAAYWGLSSGMVLEVDYLLPTGVAA